MSYYEVYNRYKNVNLNNDPHALHSCIEQALAGEDVSAEQFAALLSLFAEDYLEKMAQYAHQLTLKYFGKVIQLYTPMYLSNYCDNQCVYCGFNLQNKIERKKLELEEVEREAKFIQATGLKHILVLTGESRTQSPVSYIKESIKILKKYFSSIAVEIYPLTEEEYVQLVEEGVDGLTIYQETYDENVYSEIHPSGPKSNYKFRLDAPERGASAGMRSVSIGVLLGLTDWRKDVFSLGLHAKYLQDRFPDVEIGVSLPRIRKQVSNFQAGFNVRDKDIVQIILALRIFIPRLSISLSTRENALFRENLLPLGITRMSAGSSTYVGGHTQDTAGHFGQFEICDKRSVEEMKSMLEEKGYQPVFKDWMHI